ncbi:uncharacterized protein BO80DRAFT_456495 [Aspergillus ibericus CBS 121593]|uniref:Solid-state culture expressed protein n=1 Tax=Aspergillus ibericus CBS 121593 TaxID=1448316 RepID=A0A395GV80_9EURO|nr:hypothetical protein BO80DRAFT_456495 [Aspergillus ibericus CBS 121593]RAK99471.1 hypothetical protein BO80DRAFT_456495 [Aspergillus ibericus CBS 121593]
METLNNTFTNASNSLWGEVHPTQTPDNPLAAQHGDEPLSGIQGKGTATDPYDAGNRDEQPGAPTTRENTAVIPEALASIDVDHARNPKSPSNADFGPKNVFIDEPSRTQKMNYPTGNTTTSGAKQWQSQSGGLPEQRTQRSTYGQGSPVYSDQEGAYPQKSRDLAGTSSATSGAYAYSGQGAQDTLAVRDPASKDQGLKAESSPSSGRVVQSMPDNAGTGSLQKERDSVGPVMTAGVTGKGAKSNIDSAGAGSLQKEKEYASPIVAEGTTSQPGKEKKSLSPRTAEGAVDKQGAVGTIDSAPTLPQGKESASKSIPDGANGVASKSPMDDKEAQLQQKAKSPTEKTAAEKPSMDKSTTSGGIVDSTQKGSKEETTDGTMDSKSPEQKGKDTASADDNATKEVARNNKVSEEALRGPKTPAPREPYEFEKRLDQRRVSRSKQGTDAGKTSDEGAQNKGKESSSSSSHSHNPMTTLKEKVSKVLHHNSSNKS